MSFSELELHEQLLDSLKKNGFEEPTSIQKATIPKALANTDLIACAKTGSGKTLAYLLPILHRLIENPPESSEPAALILAPTRELAIQIQKEAAALVDQNQVCTRAVYGGADYEKQKQQLSNGVHVLAATPGRLLDFIRSKSVDLSKVELIVLDEADRMLDMGFIDDVKKILSYTKKRQQVSLFSATLNYSAVYSVWRFMNEPEEILINPELIDHSKIDQKLVHLGKEEKLPYLIQYIESVDYDPIIVFTNTKQFVEILVKNLNYHSIPSQGLSSVVNQNKRIRILDQFKERSFRVLVATDVASRGLHIDDVALVVNFDIPQDPETYVHRIGRTARAGASGNSLSISSEMDYEELMKLERYLKYKINVEEPVAKFLDNLAFVKVDLSHSDRGGHRSDRKKQGSKSRGNGKPAHAKSAPPKNTKRKQAHRSQNQQHQPRPRHETQIEKTTSKNKNFDVMILNTDSASLWSKIKRILFPWKKRVKSAPQPSAQTLERLRREEKGFSRKQPRSGKNFDKVNKKNKRPQRKRRPVQGDN